MHILLFLAVLAVVAARESAAQGPVGGGVWRMAAVLAAMSALALASVGGSLATARGIRARGLPEAPLLRRFRALRRTHLAAWFACTLLILFGLQWVRLVREDWGLRTVCLIDELLILLPVFLPLHLAWGAYYEVEHAVREAAQVRAETAIIPPRQRFRHTVLQARQELGLMLIPALGMIAVQDLCDTLTPGWRGHPAAAGMYIVALMGLIVMLPLLLKRILPTRPMAFGPLREQLEALTHQVGVPIRDLAIWETGGRLSNAAVTGLLPGLRYVFLTDALVQRLDPLELEAVLLHELGHLRRRHLLLRLLVLISPLWLWLVWQAMFPVSALRLGTAADVWSSEWGLSTPFLLSLSMAGYVLLALAWHARWLEHDADLWAVDRMPVGSTPAATRFIAALEKLAEPVARGRRSGGGWLHPSLAQRRTLVEQVERSPHLGVRFRRRLRWLHGGFVLVVLGLPLLIVALRVAGLV